MKAWLFGGLIVAVLGAVLWYMPGSPLLRLFPKDVQVPIRDAEGNLLAMRDIEIVTVLHKDGIPAILDPHFVSGSDADAQLSDQSQVIGLSINGDHRAYSLAHLSSHEVVNDTVGGVPVAVTW